MAISEIPTDKDEIKGAVENLKRNADAMIEMSSLLARIRWESYRAHLAQGFTEEQALALCAKMMFE